MANQEKEEEKHLIKQMDIIANLMAVEKQGTGPQTPLDTSSHPNVSS